ASATASASPSASIVVVDAVGASPNEHASCATEQSSATSAAAARVERLFWGGADALVRVASDPSPVIEISPTPSRLMVTSKFRISSVAPLYESAITTSP